MGFGIQDSSDRARQLSLTDGKVTFAASEGLGGGLSVSSSSTLGGFGIAKVSMFTDSKLGETEDATMKRREFSVAVPFSSALTASASMASRPDSTAGEPNRVQRYPRVEQAHIFVS